MCNGATGKAMFERNNSRGGSHIHIQLFVHRIRLILYSNANHLVGAKYIIKQCGLNYNCCYAGNWNGEHTFEAFCYANVGQRYKLLNL